MSPPDSEQTPPPSPFASAASLSLTPPEPPITTARHTLVLLPEVALMLQSIFSDIERAQKRVYIECYIIVDDALGRMLGEALLRAAARGVETRVLYDPLGSHTADASFWEGLQKGGVFVRAYRAGDSVLGKGGLAPHDHSRVMVADDAGYTGGAAWAEPWLPKSQGGEGWHDVCVRVVGPAVDDFVHVFQQRWVEASGEVATLQDIDTKDAHPDVRLIADTTRRESLVYLAHREAIQRAARRVWLENAYFFPSAPLLHDLYDAAARGVDVQIMLPAKSDLPILKHAAWSEMATWIEHGLELWEYQPRMLHSKFAVVDDDWCSIGTFNANPSSLALANEVNLFVLDRSFVARVARLFEIDRGRCERVTVEKARSRSLGDKALDALANNAMTLLDVVVGNTKE
jgi:cardiolipin synthase